MIIDELTHEQIGLYLEQISDRPVSDLKIHPLGEVDKGDAPLKAFGYGRPLLVNYDVGGQEQALVIRRVMPNGFGRERKSDRVAEVWRDYHNFSLLPQHVKARDLLIFRPEQALQSIAGAHELLLVTDYAPGQPYADDLIRIRDTGQCTDLDIQRTAALANYLADIHATKRNDALHWRRRLRDLVGHGEGIMGLADSYRADDPLVTPTWLQGIENGANRWRWHLKAYPERLSQIHGDFHPFNILFTTDSHFHVLDRSRGEWGAPEDDVSCLMINYLFFGLQRGDALQEPFTTLYTTFWEGYLSASGDEDLTAMVAPWIAWRALVLASPQWYPSSSLATRQRLMNLAHNVLQAETFAWQAVNRYLEAV